MFLGWHSSVDILLLLLFLLLLLLFLLQWFDEDAAGREGADLWASKLGISRCHVVRCTDELLQHMQQQQQPQQEQQQEQQQEEEVRIPKDANECLLAGLDLKVLLLSARRVPHQQILTFQDLRARVLHELVEPGKFLLLLLRLLLLLLLLLLWLLLGMLLMLLLLLQLRLLLLL